MKKILFIFIPSILLAILLFVILQVVLLKRFEKGALQVTSQPQSKVYLNGEYIGITPLSKNKEEDRIPVGEYEIKLIPSDTTFSEFRDTITITKSALTVVDRKFDKGGFAEGSNISLIPIGDKKKAEIMVVTFPDGVDVEIDEQPKGRTPLVIKDVAVSGHTLTLRKDGYKEKVVRVQTPPGHQLKAIVYLSVVTDLTELTASPAAALVPSVSPSPVAMVKVRILATPNGFLRVRESASTVSQEIARVNKDDELELVSEETTGWYEIKLEDGKTGFVSSQYASKIEEEE